MRRYMQSSRISPSPKCAELKGSFYMTYRTYMPKVLILCLVAGLPFVMVQRAWAGPYESLDDGILSKTLRESKMWQLHKYHAAGLSKSGDSVILQLDRATAFIDRATQPGVSESERRKQLNQAIAELRKVVSATKEASAPKATIRHMEYKLKLAITAGYLRPQPYALRMMYLRGGPSDRQNVIRLTTRAEGVLNDLDEQIEELMLEWRGDLEKVVVGIPLLQKLQEKLLYQAGWVYLYRGLALGKGPAGRHALGMATVTARKCISSRLNASHANLIWGIAERGLGRHEKAVQKLQAANADEKASVAVKMQAMFEMVQNRIDQASLELDREKRVKRYKKIKAMIEVFGDKGLKLLGKENKLQVDIHQAVLCNHVYMQAAKTEKRLKGKTKRLNQARMVFVDFINNHPGNVTAQSTLMDIIARKYGSDLFFKDTEKAKSADSLVLLAVAMSEKKTSPEAVAKSAKLLKIVLSREDPISKELEPTALWNMALLQNRLKKNIEAGTRFIAIAKQFPQHKLAPKAAEFGVMSFAGVLAEHRKNNKPISGKLRRMFVDALEILLGNAEWIKNPEIAKRFYDLGWQYEKLTDNTDQAAEKIELRRKAVQAYRKVPQADAGEYMDALRLSNELEIKLMDSYPDDAQRVSRAAELIKNLKQYSKRSVSEAQKAIEAGNTALGKNLRIWGAQADFNVAVATYSYLNQNKQAITMLRDLPKLWPDTPVLEESSEFLIRKLIEQGQTRQAIVEVEQFNRKYPQRSSQLIELVIENIQSAIRLLKSDPRKERQLRGYREGYRQFAKILYDKAVGDPKTPPIRLLDMKQMYGDALAESGGGFAKQALELFLECKSAEDKNRGTKSKEINDTFDSEIQLVISIGNEPVKLQKTIDQFIKNIGGKFGPEVKASFLASNLNKANTYLAKVLARDDGGNTPLTVPDPGGAKTILAQAHRMVLTRYKKLMESQRKAQIDIIEQDANNIWGLAKSYFALEQYSDALEHYKTLVGSLDPNKNPEKYWQAQIGYCQSAMETSRKNPEQLEGLGAYLKQLRKEDSAGGKDTHMGGYSSQFNKIESELRRLMEG